MLPNSAPSQSPVEGLSPLRSGERHQLDPGRSCRADGLHEPVDQRRSCSGAAGPGRDGQMAQHTEWPVRPDSRLGAGGGGSARAPGPSDALGVAVGTGAKEPLGGTRAKDKARGPARAKAPAVTTNDISVVGNAVNGTHEDPDGVTVSLGNQGNGERAGTEASIVSPKEPGAEKHEETLGQCLGMEVGGKREVGSSE